MPQGCPEPLPLPAHLTSLQALNVNQADVLTSVSKELLQDAAQAPGPHLRLRL